MYGFQELSSVFSAFNICRKSHVALSRSFHVHHRKPEFCQLFVLSRGKLVFQREENNEGFIEDDQEIMVGRAKEKGILRGWLGKMKHEEKNLCPTASSSTPNQSPDQWENNVEEIGSYFQQLISLNSDEGLEAENETLWNGPNVQENTVSFLFCIFWSKMSVISFQ